MKTTTTVEELKNKSTFVPKLPPGKTYKSFNVWVGEKGGGRKESIANGLIGFRVEKSWIQNNSFNESLVTLQLYNKGWEPLYTEKVREDNYYSYFKSKTPSFSFFAITYTGEASENGSLIGLKLPSIGEKVIVKSGTKLDSQDVRDKAKTLMAIALPAFLMLVGYLVIKKKI
jgi:PGF-pre-PGF domain-containing protein